MQLEKWHSSAHEKHSINTKGREQINTKNWWSCPYTENCIGVSTTSNIKFAPHQKSALKSENTPEHFIDSECHIFSYLSFSEIDGMPQFKW